MSGLAAYPDSVRVFARFVGVGLIAGWIAACGLVTGLNEYSAGQAPDASLATRHDGSVSAQQDSAGQPSPEGSGDDSSMLENEGAVGEGGDAESLGDASEDAIEEGEESDGAPGQPGVDAGDAMASEDAASHDAALETGAPKPDAGGAPEAGCGTPDTIQNCTACGLACTTAHSADAGCNGETCSYSCSPGYADCNASTVPDLDGCETHTNTTTNCSGCNVACNTSTGTPSCNGTTCSYTCNSGTADCNAGTAPDTDGCETATNTTAHCAGCSSCNTSTGTPLCNGTTCSYTCNGELLDCNAGTPPDLDGCESSASSTSTCGGCLNRCGATNSGTFSADGCNGTTCSYTCDSGHYDCNASTPPDTDGCETSESATNCGGCGQACGSTNGGTFSADSCSDTTNSCSYTCKSGNYDCNAGTPPDTDGCETPESSTNCGKCGQACGTSNTGTFSADTCVNNSCSYTCDTGHYDCNVATAPDQDGCECVGTGSGCCGGGCQTAHQDGEGQNYYDCSAVNTHSQTEAQLACEAYTGGSCSQSSTCCGAVIIVCLGTTATAYCGTNGSTSLCWSYGSVGSGNVTSGSSAACSGSVATWN
jgi:hypothetical protein